MWIFWRLVNLSVVELPKIEVWDHPMMEKGIYYILKFCQKCYEILTGKCCLLNSCKVGRDANHFHTEILAYECYLNQAEISNCLP